VFLDQIPEGVFARYDGKKIETSDELEVFEQAVVGRVGHGNRERPPLALEWKDDALGGHLGWNQPDDLGIDLKPSEINRRHAILPGQDLGNLQLLHKPELHQHVPQPVLGVFLLG
jgi:hypothetical protein